MRATFTGLLAVSGIACATAFAACNSDDNAAQPQQQSFNVSAGVGPDSPCQGGVPNGQCVMFGGNAETCDCQDCEDNAACTSRCKDDMQCQFDPGVGEDCTCSDCYGVHPECLGNICNDNSNEDEGIPNTCTAADACVCPECAGDPKCQACNGDGLCQVFTESCDCSDCTNHEACGGSTSSGSPTSSSSSAGQGGGGGGSGGSSGNGGSGGTMGNGGMGGSVGNGGSSMGGNGGAGGS